MPRVETNFRDWETMDRIDVTKFHKNSAPSDSRVTKRNVRMPSRYASSSGESNCSDDRLTPLSDFSEEAREHSLSMEEAGTNFVTFRLGDPFAMRKVSTCSETSSINSACLSLEGGCRESDGNSSCCNIHREDVSAGVNKYDDIIDKIMELRFSQKNLNAKAEDTNGSTTNKNEKRGRSTEMDNSPNRNNEDKVIKKDGTENGKNIVIDDVNGNYEVLKGTKILNGEEEHDESDDDELVQRGPVRPHCYGQARHEKPYYTLDWLAGTNQNIDQNKSYTFDYDSTAEQILRNKQFSDKLNPCLDKLSDYAQSNRTYSNTSEETRNDDFNAISGWSSPEVNYAETGTPNSNASGDDAGNNFVPSIVLSDPGEASLLEMLASGGFQAARSLSDTGSVQNPSPGRRSSENWPDSPASSYNVLSSHSHSRGSSPAQSPCSSGNIGSPMLHLNMIGSPTDSHSNLRCFRIGQALSSSGSSNHSFGDTPSPSNYQSGIDHRVEEQLGSDFDKFSTWYQNCVSSSTVVDSAETIDAIDNNELQLVEEIIRRDQRHKRNVKLPKDAQVVPISYSREGARETDENCHDKTRKNDFSSSSSKITTKCKQRLTIDNSFCDIVNKPATEHGEPKIVESSSNLAVPYNEQCDQLEVPCEQPANIGMFVKTGNNDQLGCPDLNDVYNRTYSDYIQSNSVYNNDVASSTPDLVNFEDSMEKILASVYTNSAATASDGSSTTDSSTKMDNSGSSKIPSGIAGTSASIYGEPSASTSSKDEQSQLTFDEFQIPETVASYRQNLAQRLWEHKVQPWALLCLPKTPASDILKAVLDPVKLEKAMQEVLRWSCALLAAGDEDGDTALICLVGNPSELEKKLAFVMPLVERVSKISGGLTMMNKRGEDALYMAAMNNPHMSYVTGYLAAFMVEKGINIGQILYHPEGDTLVHAIAAQGDTHAEVLAELLSLRTAQGDSVFDLSQRNYVGRTALHIAVESHEPATSGISCIRTTQLLLENGADQKIQKLNCGDTVLHTAISLSSDPALVKVLLQFGDWKAVNMRNYNNDTPLHMAAALSGAVTLERQMNICSDLIFAGAETNVLNLQGLSPLALVSPDRREAIEYLFYEKTFNQFPGMNFGNN